MTIRRQSYLDDTLLSDAIRFAPEEELRYGRKLVDRHTQDKSIVGDALFRYTATCTTLPSTVKDRRGSTAPSRNS
jgi:hypothetical protein